MLFHKNIEIFDTSYEGVGVGRLESGSIVFVPDTVTGDVVDLDIIETKKNFSFGRLTEIVSPSEMRVEPVCPHAAVCGGCQFMHIRYTDQIKVKEQIIQNAFRNIENFKIQASVSGSSEQYRLRAKFKMQAGQIGFFAKRSNRFIPVASCAVVKPSIFEKAESFAAQCHTADVNDLYVIENNNGQALASVSVDMMCEHPFDGLQAGNQHDGIPFIPMQTGFGDVFSGFSSFFQGNRYLLEQFQQSITPFIGSEDRVLELYAGSGFFSVVAAAVADRVTALEYEGEAVQLAQKIARPNLSVIKGNVDRLLAKRTYDFNTLLVDPPRAGLSKKVIQFIKEKLPEKLIYVSCNPMTMARDIDRLKGHYHLVEFRFFDMFPHTYHIETMAYLERE